MRVLSCTYFLSPTASLYWRGSIFVILSSMSHYPVTHIWVLSCYEYGYNAQECTNYSLIMLIAFYLDQFPGVDPVPVRMVLSLSCHDSTSVME